MCRERPQITQLSMGYLHQTSPLKTQRSTQKRRLKNYKSQGWWSGKPKAGWTHNQREPACGRKSLPSRFWKPHKGPARGENRKFSTLECTWSSVTEVWLSLATTRVDLENRIKWATKRRECHLSATAHAKNVKKLYRDGEATGVKRKKRSDFLYNTAKVNDKLCKDNKCKGFQDKGEEKQYTSTQLYVYSQPTLWTYS